MLVSDTRTLRERITARMNRRRDPKRIRVWAAILGLLIVQIWLMPGTQWSIIASGLGAVAVVRIVYLLNRIVDYDRHKWDNPHYVPKTQE